MHFQNGIFIFNIGSLERSRPRLLFFYWVLKQRPSAAKTIFRHLQPVKASRIGLSDVTPPPCKPVLGHHVTWPRSTWRRIVCMRCCRFPLRLACYMPCNPLCNLDAVPPSNSILQTIAIGNTLLFPWNSKLCIGLYWHLIWTSQILMVIVRYIQTEYSWNGCR